MGSNQNKIQLVCPWENFIDNAVEELYYLEMNYDNQYC
jgi:hypothetical protein